MDFTPSALLQDAYALMRMHACEDMRTNMHVPSTLAGVVSSPWNPPELHVYALLDPRQVLTAMRELAMADPAIFGFTFITVGTVLYEQAQGRPLVHEALLCLWCTAYDAAGDSYRVLRDPVLGIRLDQPQPLPDALREAYRNVFNPDATLPTMLQPTLH